MEGRDLQGIVREGEMDQPEPTAMELGGERTIRKLLGEPSGL